MNQDHTLDATGHKCPIPVLRARRALEGLHPGETLTIQATDPATSHDIPAFCKAAGHTLLSSHEKDQVFSFVIQKGNTG